MLLLPHGAVSGCDDCALKTSTRQLLSDVVEMVAEFEADLISARTREGMAIARKKGKLRGKQP